MLAARGSTRPSEVLATPLVDTSGRAYSLVEDTDKDLTLVFFGYTHCPTSAGIAMSTLASAHWRASTTSDRERRRRGLRDHRPGARHPRGGLRDYVDELRPELHRRSPATSHDIIEVAKPLASRSSKGEKLPSGGYEVTHGTQVIAHRRRRRGAVAYWSQDVSPAQLAARHRAPAGRRAA